MEFKKIYPTKVTNSNIDKFYELGINSGAIGGKILGAGGGFFLFYLKTREKKKG